MKLPGHTQPYFPNEHLPTVRVRAVLNDPYAGLKGHAYLEARGLNKKVPRVQTSAHTTPADQAEVCK